MSQKSSNTYKSEDTTTYRTVTLENVQPPEVTRLKRDSPNVPSPGKGITASEAICFHRAHHCAPSPRPPRARPSPPQLGHLFPVQGPKEHEEPPAEARLSVITKPVKRIVEFLHRKEVHWEQVTLGLSHREEPEAQDSSSSLEVTRATGEPAADPGELRPRLFFPKSRKGLGGSGSSSLPYRPWICDLP